MSLEAAGVAHRWFWIVNAVAIPGADAALIQELAARKDVNRITPDPQVPLTAGRPERRPGPLSGSRTIPWNIEQVGAPAVWATGNTGQAAVVGILDTGCDWQHPAVRDQYRGWDGTAADHDYNWHDAVHDGGGACGADAPEPCDDLGHGTHVLGTAVGDDGQGMQIGVAPGARWIACRCIDGGWSSPSLFYEGFEWMLAPRPVGGGPGDPDRAPDVVTTAWYCPPALGCTWDVLLPAVAALRAAGITVVATAGAFGPDCETILFPPAIYDESYTIGATDPADGIASFSGRGSVVTGQGTLLKPDLAAPGIDVLSCLPGDQYATWSGGAMTVAHVAGAVALVVTARPELARDPDAIEARLAEDLPRPVALVQHDHRLPRAGAHGIDGDHVPAGGPPPCVVQLVQHQQLAPVHARMVDGRHQASRPTRARIIAVFFLRRRFGFATSSSCTSSTMPTTAWSTGT